MPFLTLLFILLLDAVAASSFPEATFQELLRVAGGKKLYEDPQWLRLLHFHKSGGSMESDIDGGYFFLSPKGKGDSRAEMEATLRAFLSHEDLSPPLDSGMARARMHPLCKFRARLHFFRDRLSLTDSILPAVDCNRFYKWRNALHPSGVTLVFASSYLNNPASMFGHTFLRLNTYAGDSSRALLNYGITYGAAVPPRDGILFVYKGIAGNYLGSYSMSPYYVSVQQYLNLESRDLWEYDLNFNPSQMEYLLEHIWELGAAWMHYYFFTENCSYDILTLLEAGDPGLQLTTKSHGGMIIPAETVKWMLDKPGFVTRQRWRPSLLNSFRLKADGMGKAERTFLKKLIRGPQPDLEMAANTAGFSADTLTRLADAALDYVQYRKRRSTGKDSLDWSVRQSRLLKARLSFPSTSATSILQPDDRISPPEKGHGSRNISVAAGSSDYRLYAELGGRLGYHDMNAREKGFLPGSQIEVAQFRARVYYGRLKHFDPRFELQSVDLLNIQSLTPMDAFQSPPSWAIRLGMEKRPGKVPSGGYSYLAEGGIGATGWFRGSVTWMPYVLAQTKIRVAQPSRWVPSLGPQARIGSRFSWGENQSLWGEYRIFQPLLYGKGYGAGREQDFCVEYRLSAGRNSDFRLNLLMMDGIGQASLIWNRYF